KKCLRQHGRLREFVGVVLQTQAGRAPSAYRMAFRMRRAATAGSLHESPIIADRGCARPCGTSRTRARGQATRDARAPAPDYKLRMPLAADRSSIGQPGSRGRLRTPALVVDVDALERNIARMAEHCRRSGITLRPHTKTHKSVVIARMQIAAGAA